PISAASEPVATARRVAPPASAAVAQASAPWPYPSALITAQSSLSAPSSTFSRAQLRSTAPRSIRATARSIGLIAGDERGQRVGPGDKPGEAALAVDNRQVVVVLLGDRAGDRLGVIVAASDDR